MPVVTAQHRERLEQIRERTKTARGQRSRARQLLDACREGNDLEGQAVAQIQYDAADQDLAIAERLESQLLSAMAGVDSGVASGFLHDPSSVAQLEQLAHSSLPVGTVNLGVGMSADELIRRIETGDWGSPQRMAAAGEALTTDASRVGVYGGVQRAPRRALRLLDLIPVAPMDGLSFPYSQEVITSDAAAEVVEGAVKPQSQIDFQDAEVRAATIAHFTKMRRQQLADLPSMEAIVRDRLAYGVLRRVEDQVIAGDGTGENLQGILNTTGLASVTFNAAVPLAELPLEAVVDVILADAEPNAVVLHPRDWATMVADKNAGDEYYSNGPFGPGVGTLWELPAVRSRAIAHGTALVGDFANGATLFVREGVGVRLSDSDQDDFIRNRVTALGEGRFGLAVWQPAAFATVDLAA